MSVRQTDLFKIFETKDRKKAIIRPVELNDAERLTLIVKEILNEGLIQKESARSIDEEIKFITSMNTNNNMYVCVEVDQTVVGIARLVRGELQMKRHVALFRTWLVRKAQGKGIGKEIMEYTKQWAKDNGVEKICLTVFARNEVATNLYKRYGFEVEGVQRKQVFFNHEYDDEIFMAYFTEA